MTFNVFEPTADDVDDGRRQRAIEALAWATGDEVSLVEALATRGGTDLLEWIAAVVAEVLAVEVVLVGELCGDDGNRVRTLALERTDCDPVPLEYALEDTPCQEVVRCNAGVCSSDVAGTYPMDGLPGAADIRAYAGVPLVSTCGRLLGLIAVFGHEPLHDPDLALAVLELLQRPASDVLAHRRATSELDALVEGTVEPMPRRPRRQLEVDACLCPQRGGVHDFDGVVGSSAPLIEVLDRIGRVAPTATTVLLTGETGTGKDLLARAIHERSTRSDRPFVAVNCGAIPSELVESELFGHEPGCFTGATQGRRGRFELADGGTIFLDEIAELPLVAQVKLLRILQEGELDRVGSEATIDVDVRVVAATNRDLEDAVAQGRFRADLFYRINVFPVEVPPLRARREDVLPLAHHFVAQFAEQLGKHVEGLTPEAAAWLLDHDWPGNVRELKNVIERAVVLAGGPLLAAGEVDVGPRKGCSAEGAEGSELPPVAGSALLTADEAARAHILRVLEHTGGVVEGDRGAARILGLHPNTLRSRMQRLDIQRPR